MQLSRKSATSRFQDVMEGSVITTVDPLACVPMTNIRKISPSGVARLTTIISSTGFTAGSDVAIVMPLTGAHRHVLCSYWTGTGLSASEAREKMESRDQWFGVVDGMHRHSAILELIEKHPETWEGFRWPVTLLKGGVPLLTLKQLARVQNAKHSETCFVEPTLFDMLNGLREEHDRLKTERNSKKVTAADVAAAYDGSSHAKESTVKQIAATASRLPLSTIEVIGEIMNEEHPELAASSFSRSDTSVTKENVKTKFDCRVFRKFINITSLKQATIFMKASGTDGEQTQINTLYRLREIFKENGFKPVQFAVVCEQYKKASMALSEAFKFERFLESDKWPTAMAAVKQNLTQTTKLDDEVEENSGNGTLILPFLKDLYFKLHPASAPMREAKYNQQYPDRKQSEQSPSPVQETGEKKCLDGEENVFNSFESPNNTGSPDVDVQEAHVDVPSEGENRDSLLTTRKKRKLDGSQESDDEKKRNESHEIMDGQELIDKPCKSSTKTFPSQTSQRLETRGNSAEENRISQHSMLEKMGIHCFQMTWEEYDKSVRQSDDGEIDLLLTDPPYGLEPNASGTGRHFEDMLDDKEIVSFCQFAARVVKPGGFLFIFSSVRFLQKWISFLRETNFKVMSHVYSLVKKTAGMQHHRLSAFPQNATEYGVVARKNGRHPQQFEPDFISPYHRIDCSLPRRFASITGIPVTRNKLQLPGKKIPVRVEEKNTDLLIEIMTTFCPEGGSVLDTYAGTFTTALACLETGRTCTSIEKDLECFRLAYSRLARRLSSSSQKTNTESERFRRNQEMKKAELGEESNNSVTKSFNCDALTRTTKTPEEACKHLLPDRPVKLMVNGEVVADAQLALPAPGEIWPIRRTLHNHNLADPEYSNNGVCLVVIWRIRVINGKDHIAFPYISLGTGEEVKKLGDLTDSFYAWDACSLRMSES